jgi:IS1 family transposase
VKKDNRPPLNTLACTNPHCQDHGLLGKDNLRVIREYGKHDRIRYLKCNTCKTCFSERKNTPLWNARLPEAEVASIAEHLSDKCCYKSSARLTKHSKNTVKHYAKRIGYHARDVHDQLVLDVQVNAVEFDERHGFAQVKTNKLWEANAIDPKTKFMLELTFGTRTEDQIKNLMTNTKNRLRQITDLLVMTDGLSLYNTLFPEVFGVPYAIPRTRKQRLSGRKQKFKQVIPRGVALLQLVKQYKGNRVLSVDERLTFGSKKTLNKGLKRLGYRTGNTSAIERFNGTNRGMNAFQVRKGLSFARREESRVVMGWLVACVYNWCRLNRAVRVKLEEPVGKRLFEDRTPAMAIGLASRVWSVLDLLRVQVFMRKPMGSV